MRIYFPNSDAYLMMDETYHEYTVVRKYLQSDDESSEFYSYIDGWEKIQCEDDPNWFHLVFREKSGKVFFPTLANVHQFDELTPDRDAEMRAIRFCVAEEGHHLCFRKADTNELFQSILIDIRNPEVDAVMFEFSTTDLPELALDTDHVGRPHVQFIDSPPIAE